MLCSCKKFIHIRMQDSCQIAWPRLLGPLQSHPVGGASLQIDGLTHRNLRTSVRGVQKILPDLRKGGLQLPEGMRGSIRRTDRQARRQAEGPTIGERSKQGICIGKRASCKRRRILIRFCPVLLPANQLPTQPANPEDSKIEHSPKSA